MYYQQYQSTAALASERGEFIRKVYMNLALGFVGFIALEAFLLTWQPAVELAQKMVTGSNWLIVLLAFMGVSWLANSWAVNGATLGKQYAGFALYIIAESIIFLPLLIFANMFAPRHYPASRHNHRCPHCRYQRIRFLLKKRFFISRLISDNSLFRGARDNRLRNNFWNAAWTVVLWGYDNFCRASRTIPNERDY